MMGTVLILLGMAAGAESDSPHPIIWAANDKIEQPYVQVDYSGEVIANDSFSYTEPDIGKEYLLVSITIANLGYYDVFSHPFRYMVDVNNVKYAETTESYGLDDIGKRHIDYAHLGDGERISGYMLFQIPVNSTEFELIFDSYPHMDVRYNNTAVERYVQVDYSGEVIANDSFSYSEPDIGKEYMLVSITIANHGYDYVIPSMDNFEVVVKNVKYAFENVSYNLDIIGKPYFQIAELGDGGQISGYLVYQIPADATDWALIFDHYTPKEIRYNVRYNKITVEGGTIIS